MKELKSFLKTQKLALAKLGYLLLIITVAILSYVVGRDHFATQVPASPSEILVESNIGGVKIAGEPYCDSNKLKVVTPYSCLINEEQPSTTLVAPEYVMKDGKDYRFQTWEGCSFTDSPRYICRVSGVIGTPKKVKVIYSQF